MRKIICIGAGRLAHHLMPELERAGCEVVQVYNRTEAAALLLAKRLGAASFTSDVRKIHKEADAYFFTLADDAIPQIAGQVGFLENHQSLFLHCSGVLPLAVLPFQLKGSFYPLQTFSPHHDIPWKTTPILITAEEVSIRKTLSALAHRVTASVYEVTDENKSILHLGAVFANNFTNHMMALAEKICIEHHVPFDILKPLIRETFEKALEGGPSKSQTGPAIRGDQKTIEKHMNLLAGHPGMQEIYKVITHSIREISGYNP